MNTITNQTTTQPRTQRFYCEGCREYHEAPALLEAVRTESSKINTEKVEANSDGTELVAEISSLLY